MARHRISLDVNEHFRPKHTKCAILKVEGCEGVSVFHAINIVDIAYLNTLISFCVSKAAMFSAMQS